MKKEPSMPMQFVTVIALAFFILLPSVHAQEVASRFYHCGERAESLTYDEATGERIPTNTMGFLAKACDSGRILEAKFSPTKRAVVTLSVAASPFGSMDINISFITVFQARAFLDKIEAGKLPVLATRPGVSLWRGDISFWNIYSVNL
jgi:hypothetical protein